MRKVMILTSEEVMTLKALTSLNNEILLCGLTKDNSKELEELQAELINIVHKFLN